MNHLFIINPNAGKGKSLEIIPLIEKIFKNMKDRYIIEITKSPGDATLIAKKYSSQEDYTIYSVGGDGTLNEVLNGMVNTNSHLAIIPTGSGNDFIKSISRKNEFNLENILIDTISGTIKKTDVAIVNARYFINISSIGFDADVVRNAMKFKKLPFIPSKLSYLFSIFLTVFSHKNKDLEIILDDNKINNKITLMALFNGKFYGGGMLVAPEAKLCDGYFDVCLVEDLSIFKILTLFPKLIKGKHGEIKEVSFFKSRKAIIKSEKELNLNIDGELVQAKHIEFEIKPNAINVVYPSE